MIYENSMLILDLDKHGQKMYHCHGPGCPQNEPETLYSWHHAKVKGWRSTKSMEYSPDGKEVMLCPDCVEQLKEKHKGKQVDKQTSDIGEELFDFGQYGPDSGEACPVWYVVAEDPQYVSWLLNNHTPSPFIEKLRTYFLAKYPKGY